VSSHCSFRHFVTI